MGIKWQIPFSINDTTWLYAISTNVRYIYISNLKFDLRYTQTVTALCQTLNSLPFTIPYMPKSIYFNTELPNSSFKLDSQFKVTIWKPSIFDLIPPGKPFKYILFTFFTWFRVFKNNNYFYIRVYHNKTLVSSVMVVPAYFRWKYMDKNDIQFIYVTTNEAYRGQNLAASTIVETLKYLKSKVNLSWYVTSSDNIASQRVAIKLGFKEAEIIR
jgi:hypothetical protein